MPLWPSYFSARRPAGSSDFSSLDFEQKCQLVRELMELRRLYRVLPEMFNGQGKNCAGPSHLKKKELMMLGELDQDEADDLISPSLEKAMMMLDLDSEEALKLYEESCKKYELEAERFEKLDWNDIDKYMEETCMEEEDEEEYYVPRSFKQHIHSFEGPVYPSSYNEENFIDKKFNASDDNGKLKTYILRGDTESLTEMKGKEYRKKMEQLQERRKQRLV